MEVKRTIKTILTQEEYDLVRKTADLLNDICFQYDKESCDFCPMHAFCNNNYDKPTHNQLYDMLDRIEVK